MKRIFVQAAVALVAGGAASGQAVYLSQDGKGQALIYPYYTVQSAGGNAFNTYFSIVNHADDGKALRVRFRESRDGLAVASLNVYLGRGDVWTAALVPDGAGSRLLTRDLSCTEPLLPTVDGVPSLSISTLAGIERTREGYVEVLEMATLGPLTNAAITFNASGLPNNCAAVRQPITETMGAPTGGLSGTLTLINVADGSDFSVNADALAELASRPYHRTSNDTYPGFAAVEVDPVSVVTAGGSVYRSAWPTGLQAVSGAYMRSEVVGEYALDRVTQSMTDVVLTFPTRAYLLSDMLPYVMPPFIRAGSWTPGCGLPPNTNPIPDTLGSGELFEARFANREQRQASQAGSSFPESPEEKHLICAAAAVMPVGHDAAQSIVSLTGSVSKGLSSGGLAIPSVFENGWVRLRPTANNAGTIPSITSLPTSTRMDIASGQVTAGAHRYTGLPMTGFALRTLRNGMLSCGAGACQGNYGSAFPLKYSRLIQ